MFCNDKLFINTRRWIYNKRVINVAYSRTNNLRLKLYRQSYNSRQLLQLKQQNNCYCHTFTHHRELNMLSSGQVCVWVFQFFVCCVLLNNMTHGELDSDKCQDLPLCLPCRRESWHFLGAGFRCVTIALSVSNGVNHLVWFSFPLFHWGAIRQLNSECH